MCMIKKVKDVIRDIHSYPKINSFIFLQHIISSFQSSFKATKSWIQELQKHAAPNIVLAIAGNKVDLEDLREVPYRSKFLSAL